MKGRDDMSSSSFGGKDSEVILCARAGTVLMLSVSVSFWKEKDGHIPC